MPDSVTKLDVLPGSNSSPDESLTASRLIMYWAYDLSQLAQAQRARGLTGSTFVHGRRSFRPERRLWFSMINGRYLVLPKNRWCVRPHHPTGSGRENSFGHCQRRQKRRVVVAVLQGERSSNSQPSPPRRKALSRPAGWLLLLILGILSALATIQWLQHSAEESLR